MSQWLLIAALVLLPWPADAATRPVVMTTDCGADMDDQWALALLALSPEFDVRGVVTTHAPDLAKPAAETSARVAQDVLAHMPMRQRPRVLAGSSTPLASKTAPLMNAGVEFLLAQTRGFSPRRRLMVLVTGAATDVASALLADKSFGDRIEIVAMGFDKWPEGGDPYNVKNDVKAWQVLLESRAPITVGDVAVTARDLVMTKDRARELFAGRGDAGRYLAGVQNAWVDQHGDLCAKSTGRRDAWPVWDVVTVAYLLGLTKSDVHPRPALGDDLRFIHPPARGRGERIRWVTSIDSPKLWSEFTRRLDDTRRRNRMAAARRP